MHTQIGTTLSLTNLKYLPAFAEYLLGHLREYAEQQLLLSRNLNLPLLKSLGNRPDEQLIQIAMESSREYLTYLAKNKAEQQIEQSLIKWIKNQLPHIDQKDVIAEDITLLNYIRKQNFLYFITGYTNDVKQLVALIHEIDMFLTRAETESVNTYIDLLRSRLNEQSYLNEKITNTSPGIIYLFNLETGSISFANQTAEEFFGLTNTEIIALGNTVLRQLIHPDDIEATLALIDEIKNAKTKEDWTLEFRLKDKEGHYLWMRNYISVFKKNERNYTLEIIGNILNIDAEKETAEQLKQSEERYKQASRLSYIGHFTLNLRTNDLFFTEELNRIYGLPLEKSFHKYDDIIRLRHPDDGNIVREKLEEALNTRQPFDFYYRIITKEKHEKSLHILGGLVFDAANNPIELVGTVQDVTERQNLIWRLQESEFLYKQAEELAKLGNWIWELESNQLIWSDEACRIYNLEPGSKITGDEMRVYTDPADKELVDWAMKRSIEEGVPHDFIYRITLPDGTKKVLHAKGQPVMDSNGRCIRLYGTLQDETERQRLVEQLQHSESLYRQAEKLANMGNYTWDIATNNIEWTDQLFLIYGLEAQAEKITLDRFISFVHPDYKETIQKALEKFFEEHSIDYTFKIITAQGEIKTLRSIAQLQVDAAGKPLRVIGTEQDVTERENLILRLQESEKLHKQAQSLAHLGNWSIDLKTNIFTWSDEMYHIYEVSKENIFTAKEWESYIYPEERASVIQYLNECIEQKKPYERSHRIVLKNGKIKVIHRKGELVFDEKGNPVRMIGTTQDITEQNRIQQELKENQNFIRKIADATPSIITSYNVNSGKYVFISEGLEKLLGYNSEQLLTDGVSFFVSIIHPDDLSKMMQKNTEALELANANPSRNDMVVEFTYRMKHRNGQYRWFHTYGTIFDRNVKGLVEHVLNISLDVTEQVAASKKIEEQEHFIQHIADASPTILYVFDVEKNGFLYVNREIYFVLGYTPEEIIEMGDKVTENLYHPDDINLLPERKLSTKKIAGSDLMIQYECRMKTKDSEWQWFLVREVVFKTNEENKILQIVGAALDITKRKDMEKTLLQNSFQLEQSNASLEEFAYVASHDLKEPLRKISTFGDRLVATQAELMSADGKIYLKKIIDASQRMQIMISDLLSISMISGNKSFERYSLQQILEETLQTLEHKIEQKNAIIEADTLPDANIIPSQFRQLFQNLLSNSLKFVREDVQPVITVRHKILNAEDITFYQLSAAPKYLQMVFTDNGIGFEMEYAGKIFAIFQRLHGRSEYEGSGIGLAICKKIVEHHGGIIYASGVPNEGASFTIILPA